MIQGVLSYAPVSDGRYVLRESFTWNDGQHVVTVPAGFVTDFASIPWALRPMLPRHARYSPAAVIHDYCYEEMTGKLSKRTADLIFYRALRLLSVPRSRARAMYWAVRCFGRGAW